MFVPNNSGLLSSINGTNAFGEITHGKARRVACGVVDLAGAVEKTAVRADSSASRGAADEVQSVATILFKINVAPRLGDLFVIAGRRLRIISIAPRYAVAGFLDHFECDFEAFPK